MKSERLAEICEPKQNVFDYRVNSFQFFFRIVKLAMRIASIGTNITDHGFLPPYVLHDIINTAQERRAACPPFMRSKDFRDFGQVVVPNSTHGQSGKTKFHKTICFVEPFGNRFLCALAFSFKISNMCFTLQIFNFQCSQLFRQALFFLLKWPLHVFPT